MAWNFQRALYKLNFEHQLDLHDPDLTGKSLGDSLDFQLCRDAKDLWQYHYDRWEYVINRFNTQAPSIRTQWIPKPHGDPTTTYFEVTSQTTSLKNLFRRLLQEEKARCKMAISVPSLQYDCHHTNKFQLHHHQQRRFLHQRNKR